MPSKEKLKKGFLVWIFLTWVIWLRSKEYQKNCSTFLRLKILYLNGISGERKNCHDWTQTQTRIGIQKLANCVSSPFIGISKMTLCLGLARMANIILDKRKAVWKLGGDPAVEESGLGLVGEMGIQQLVKWSGRLWKLTFRFSNYNWTLYEFPFLS